MGGRKIKKKEEEEVRRKTTVRKGKGKNEEGRLWKDKDEGGKEKGKREK